MNADSATGSSPGSPAAVDGDSPAGFAPGSMRPFSGGRALLRLRLQRSSASESMVLDLMGRIADKLSGKDETMRDETPLAVGDHVETLLARAANSERLAQMYEGWAAWI